MPQDKTAKELHDVSHLFLSKSVSGTELTKRRIEASIILCFLGRGFCRAYVSAGFAAAMRAEGGSVTLIEIGSGLPNAGYYFGLEPNRYLAPVVDHDVHLSELVDESIRYIYSPDPNNWSGEIPSAPSFPHFILSAFTCSSTDEADYCLTRLERRPADFGAAPDSGRFRPEGFVLFNGLPGAEACGELAASVATRYPGAVLYLVQTMTHQEFCRGVDEVVYVPEDFESAPARRMPPGGTFFRDIVGSLMQSMSSRRKRAGRHGT